MFRVSDRVSFFNIRINPPSQLGAPGLQNQQQVAFRLVALLPIPVLDGGHLAFYAIEAVSRRPVSQRGQEWAFRTGLALVAALMLFVTFNDVASLRVFGG